MGRVGHPQEPAQLVGDHLGAGEHAQAAVVRDGHGAALLRYHDAERIGALREPERRGVTRAAHGRQVGICGQRQVDGEAGDLVALQQHRAVVAR